MSIFELYLRLGFQHIADLQGYDHILFITTLCAVYLLHEWRHVLVLVTAFTIGHSITLALATLNLFYISTDLIEFLIPVTILVTAIANVYYKGTNFSKKHHYTKYVITLFFGLIHGLGFSNYLRSLLGAEQSIVKPLLAFNVGLELGQLLIVAVVMVIAHLLTKKWSVPFREWNLLISGAAMGISLILILERWPV